MNIIPFWIRKLWNVLWSKISSRFMNSKGRRFSTFFKTHNISKKLYGFFLIKDSGKQNVWKSLNQLSMALRTSYSIFLSAIFVLLIWYQTLGTCSCGLWIECFVPEGTIFQGMVCKELIAWVESSKFNNTTSFFRWMYK